MYSLAGSFLISRPELTDPNFDGTLTLILEHTEDGALGVIVNRPSGLAVADAFPDWAEIVAPPSMIFEGGPVEQDGLVALGWGAWLEGELPLGLSSVDLGGQVALAQAAGLERLRIFAGYAGWGGGQLEGEMGMGAWWVVPATLDDVFRSEPENTWPAVLRRNGGELAWYAHFPADASLN